MTLDAKWLEILKASGWQTSFLAVAFGAVLLVMHMGFLVSPSPWFTALCALAFAICLSLALASIGHAIADFLQPRKWLAEWIFVRQQRKAVREYIPFMTKHEKEILAYLLAKNLKIITTDQDGGFATTLISRGILRCALRPNQAYTVAEVPLAVPDHIWDELIKQRETFPYTPPNRRDGVEPHPWRVPWMAR
jgi:hypothetical protein